MREPSKRLTGELIDGVLNRGQCEFISEIAEALSIKLFLTFASLPMEDFERLRPIASHAVRTSHGTTQDDFMRSIDDYLEPIVKARLDVPGDDALSRIFSEPVLGQPATPNVAIALARDLFWRVWMRFRRISDLWLITSRSIQNIAMP